MTDHLDSSEDPRADADLVSAFRDGEQAAAAELYRRYYLRLVHGIVAKLPSLEVAEDCVGTAFLRVLEIIRRGKGPTSNVYGYLRSTVASESANYYRSSDRLVSQDDFDDQHDLLASTVEEDAEIDESNVQSALRTLPADWREIVTLRYIENKMPAEIALLLGTEVSSLSRTLYRAKNKLRDAYLEQFVLSRSIGSCANYSGDIAKYATNQLKTKQLRATLAHLQFCLDCQQNLAEVQHHSQRATPEALGLALLLGGIGAGSALALGGGSKAAAAAVAPKLLTAGSTFQTLGIFGSAMLVTVTVASLAVGGWLAATGEESKGPSDPAPTADSHTAQPEEPKVTTVATKDGDCELTVIVDEGRLRAEATVHRGECWFRYQPIGGETQPEVKAKTGWLVVTRMAGEHEFTFRSKKDSTSYTVTL